MRAQSIQFAIVTTILAALPCAAVTLHVPSEYATIQAALDVSVAGDVVLVAPGTYTHSETRIQTGGFPWTACAFMVDGVVLRSEGGPEVTTIDMLQALGPQPRVILARHQVSGQTAIEGFTITGAPVGGSGAYASFSGRVTFRDCVFRDLDAGVSSGGGIAVTGELILERCAFVNCIADDGGAIAHTGGRIEMYDCQIRACGNAAILLINDLVPPTESSYIEGCTFENCWGPALFIDAHHGGSIVRNCRFIGNVGAAATGAMSIDGFSPTPKIVEGCLFSNNSAPGPNGRGGGLRVGGGATRVLSNTFYGNTCTSSVGGAAISFGGGSSGDLRNNLFASNPNTGGAVYAEGIPLVSNCNVFWQNAPGTYFTPSATDRIADPLLCDPEAGDFELMVGSPCLPPGSLGCGLIGAFGEGSCGVISVDASSWGEVKAAYRGEEGGR
jgi:hypothetical protein